MKGMPQLNDLEYFESKLKSRYAGKKLAGLSIDCHPHNHSLPQCGFDYRVFNWPATAAVYAALRGKVKRKFDATNRGTSLLRSGLRARL